MSTTLEAIAETPQTQTPKLKKYELFDARRIAASNCLDLCNTDPTLFWEEVFAGKNPQARLALTDNDGINLLADDSPDYGNAFNKNSPIKWTEQFLIYRNEQTICESVAIERHVYNEKIVFQKLMTPWKGKKHIRKPTQIREDGEISNNGTHMLVPVKKDWCVMLPDIEVANPNKDQGILFHKGTNTSKSLYKAAMSICHLKGLTDKDDYEKTYNQIYQLLFSYSQRMLTQALREHADYREDPRYRGKQTYRRMEICDHLVLTGNNLGPWGVDQLAVWLTWNNKTEKTRLTF